MDNEYKSDVTRNTVRNSDASKEDCRTCSDTKLNLSQAADVRRVEVAEDFASERASRLTEHEARVAAEIMARMDSGRQGEIGRPDSVGRRSAFAGSQFPLEAEPMRRANAGGFTLADSGFGDFVCAGSSIGGENNTFTLAETGAHRVLPVLFQDGDGEESGEGDSKPRSNASATWSRPGVAQPKDPKNWDDPNTHPKGELCDVWKEFYELTFWVPLARKKIRDVKSAVAARSDPITMEDAIEEAISQAKSLAGKASEMDDVDDTLKGAKDSIRRGEVSSAIIPGDGDAQEDLTEIMKWALRNRVITQDLSQDGPDGEKKPEPCPNDNCDDGQMCATVIRLLHYEVLGVAWQYEVVINSIDDGKTGGQVWGYEATVYVRWWVQVYVRFEIACECYEFGAAPPPEAGTPPESGTGSDGKPVDPPNTKGGDWKPFKKWEPEKKLPDGGKGIG